MRKATIVTTVLFGLMSLEACSDSGKDNSPAQQQSPGSATPNTAASQGDATVSGGSTSAAPNSNTNAGGSGGSGAGNGQGTQPAGQGGQGTSTHSKPSNPRQ